MPRYAENVGVLEEPEGSLAENNVGLGLGSTQTVSPGGIAALEQD